MAESAQLIFSHTDLGQLVIDNGLDDAEWTYGLNTQTFPTYGGEVVQILSVYIDDLKLSGTVTTYAQMEAIYKYFVSYIQIATQGTGQTITPDVLSGSAYNLWPVYLHYPAREWFFKIYPKNVPGFHYGWDVVAPTWQVDCFVVDDTPDLTAIKKGIEALHVTNNMTPTGDTEIAPGDTAGLFTINGLISPLEGDPNKDPFETYDAGATAAQQQIMQFADYYSSLIGPWSQGDLSSLAAGIGSQPNNMPSSTSTPTVTIPKTPKK
jgi:hypothetical protein